MKKLVFVCLVAVACIVAGCASWEKNLPLVNAEHFEYHRAGAVSASDLVVENLHVTETEVSADSIEVTSSIPFVGAVRVIVKQYKRDRRATAPP